MRGGQDFPAYIRSEGGPFLWNVKDAEIRTDSIFIKDHEDGTAADASRLDG